MSAPAIKVEALGKKYTLGVREKGYKTFREAMVDTALSPLRWVKGQRGPRPEQIWALKDVSFEVQPGEAIGIIGRNGAGKTTLLKILSKITVPTTGRAIIRGRVGSLLEVGTGFHPELSGRENIYMNGSILGMRKAEIDRKFDEIVAFAEIEKFLDTPVKRYSSGMYVRLAFAVAAHLEPEILLVDEVLAVGDAQFQKKCLGKMGEVAKEGRTVLFVSHNMSAIMSICKSAVLLKYGLLVEVDKADKVVNSYLSDLRTKIYSKEWQDIKTAPQNESVVLRKIYFCNNNAASLSDIYTDIDFNIVLEFMIKRDGASAGFTFQINDKYNYLVFSSINNHEKNWYGKRMPVGIYKTTCSIPANLMSNGWFTINIILFGMSFSDAVTVKEVLNIDILDGPTVRGDFFGDYCSPIRPMLNWKTEKIE